MSGICDLGIGVLPGFFNIAREFIKSGYACRSDMSRAYMFSNEAFRVDHESAVKASQLTECLSLQVERGEVYFWRGVFLFDSHITPSRDDECFLAV